MKSLQSNPYNGHRPTKEIQEIILEIVNHLDAMVAYWDIDQVCVFANNAYQAWFGKTNEQIVGFTLQALLGPLYPKNLPYILAAYAGQIQVFERAIPHPNGSIRYSLTTYTPHIVDGQVHGMFVHVADVTPLKTLEQELRVAKEQAEVLATHDFLTGLPNRMLLLDRIVAAIALAKRKQMMAALFMIDVDGFKQINDTYGHDVGDQLLVQIAARLKNALHESDTITRWGGDEFLLVASEIEADTHVETIASRVLESVWQPFQLPDGNTVPTFSVGIALYPKHGTTPETLLANADQALYVAKRLGKNRYALANAQEA